MSSQRFAPEFKDEAVRQIVERGCKVAEVAEAVGRADYPAQQPPDADRDAGVEASYCEDLGGLRLLLPTPDQAPQG